LKSLTETATAVIFESLLFYWNSYFSSSIPFFTKYLLLKENKRSDDRLFWILDEILISAYQKIPIFQGKKASCYRVSYSVVKISCDPSSDVTLYSLV